MGRYRSLCVLMDCNGAMCILINFNGILCVLIVPISFLWNLMRFC